MHSLGTLIITSPTWGGVIEGWANSPASFANRRHCRTGLHKSWCTYHVHEIVRAVWLVIKMFRIEVFWSWKVSVGMSEFMILKLVSVSMKFAKIMHCSDQCASDEVSVCSPYEVESAVWLRKRSWIDKSRGTVMDWIEGMWQQEILCFRLVDDVVKQKASDCQL